MEFKRIVSTCLLGLVFVACGREPADPAQAPATASSPESAAPTATSAEALVYPKNCKATCPGSTCLTADTITSAYNPPDDACADEIVGQFNVDVFSWNMFIAASWPADPKTCAADQSKSILTAKPTDTAVWQTWANDSDVFVSSGKPKPWCTQDGLTLDDVAKAEPMFAALGAEFRGISEPSSDVTQVQGTGVLTDQNGRWVRYQKLLNNTEYSYIVDNNLWNKAGQTGQTINQTPGSVEVKAAWKVLNDQEIASNRFYMTKATVYNTPSPNPQPSPAKNPVTLGLVGLHLITKTPKFPRYMWATFEHIDNDTKWFHNDASNQVPNKQTATPPYMELKPDGSPNALPVQVERVKHPGVPSSPEATAYYRGLLKGTVWENYTLVATQWPQGVNPNGIPAIVANTVIETYIQNTSSCMGCHNGARTAAGTSANMSFLFREAK